MTRNREIMWAIACLTLAVFTFVIGYWFGFSYQTFLPEEESESPIVIFNNETNQYVCTVGLDCVCKNMNKKEELKPKYWVNESYFEKLNNLDGYLHFVQATPEGYECLLFDEIGIFDAKPFPPEHLDGCIVALELQGVMK